MKTYFYKTDADLSRCPNLTAATCKPRTIDFQSISIQFLLNKFVFKTRIPQTELLHIKWPKRGRTKSVGVYLLKAWNYNANRNKIEENILLYARLSLQVAYCYKG